jgi:DNA-binding IclR family transcriptional regulator
MRVIASQPGSRVEELVEATGMKEKTLRNHIAELKALNLVVQKGRGSGLYLTEWGRLVARALELG